MGTGVAAEQATEVMAHHGTVLTTLLKQEASNGGLHQPVLVPLGCSSMNTPMARCKSSGIWFSTLTWTGIASGVSCNSGFGCQPNHHATAPAVMSKSRNDSALTPPSFEKPCKH